MGWCCHVVEQATVTFFECARRLKTLIAAAHEPAEPQKAADQMDGGQIPGQTKVFFGQPGDPARVADRPG